MRQWIAAGLISAALIAAAAQAHASDDSVTFFSNVHITPDAPVHDAVCFFCNLRDDGTVSHDIVVSFSSVEIDGSAQHDVVTIFGNVHAADNASIGNDLVNVFGNVDLGENVTIGHDAVTFFSSVHAPSSVRVDGNRVSIPAVIFWGPAALFFLIIALIVIAVPSRRSRWPSGYPPQPM